MERAQNYIDNSGASAAVTSSSVAGSGTVPGSAGGSAKGRGARPRPDLDQSYIRYMRCKVCSLYIQRKLFRVPRGFIAILIPSGWDGGGGDGLAGGGGGGGRSNLRSQPKRGDCSTSPPQSRPRQQQQPAPVNSWVPQPQPPPPPDQGSRVSFVINALSLTTVHLCSTRSQGSEASGTDHYTSPCVSAAAAAAVCDFVHNAAASSSSSSGSPGSQNGDGGAR